MTLEEANGKKEGMEEAVFLKQCFKMSSPKSAA
jgi:hypothetical protein